MAKILARVYIADPTHSVHAGALSEAAAYFDPSIQMVKSPSSYMRAWKVNISTRCWSGGAGTSLYHNAAVAPHRSYSPHN